MFCWSNFGYPIKQIDKKPAPCNDQSDKLIFGDESTTMENMVFGRACKEEMPRIIAMQADIFSGEQGIPSEDIDAFMAKGPICWRAGSDGKLYAAAAAWKENDEIHWGRFGVFPAARGLHIGTGLIRSSFAEMLHEGVVKLYMDARDAAVKIVCGMGSRIAGGPYESYEGNVPPVVLTKDDLTKT